jgi:hypothetical protein
MTLNVIVNNYVAVDSQVSIRQRTSDDWKKSEKFEGEKYHGILIGNGQGLQLLKGEKFVRHNNAENIDLLMNKLESEQHSIAIKQRKEYQDRKEDEIRTKYRTISDPAKREELITREYSTEMDQLVQRLNQSQPTGSLYIVAFDKNIKELRKFVLPDVYNGKVTDMEGIPVITDGSGGDLAGAYLTTQTSGIDWAKLSPAHNIYLTTLACAVATANSGVGGFMQVASVDENGVTYLDHNKVNAAVKICSKQVAGDISKKEALQYVEQVFSKEPKYDQIANALDIKENDLLYTPTNLHQDVAKFNRLYQNNNEKK